MNYTIRKLYFCILYPYLILRFKLWSETFKCDKKTKWKKQSVKMHFFLNTLFFSLLMWVKLKNRLQHSFFSFEFGSCVSPCCAPVYWEQLDIAYLGRPLALQMFWRTWWRAETSPSGSRPPHTRRTPCPSPIHAARRTRCHWASGSQASTVTSGSEGRDRHEQHAFKAAKRKL